MTQYNRLNVTLSNSRLNKLNSKVKLKFETEVVLRLSSNMIVNSHHEANFPHILLLTNRQFANLGKVLQIIYQLYIKLSKTQLSKMI